MDDNDKKTVQASQESPAPQMKNQEAEAKASSPLAKPHKSTPRLIIGAIILIIVLVTSAWYFTSQPSVSKALQAVKLYKGKIVIGYIKGWPGHVGLYLARDKGYFKEAGLDVELRSYDGGTPITNDFVKGVIQGRGDLTSDSAHEAYLGFGHKGVVVIDYSNGADGIISQANIKSFADAKGKRFGYEKGSIEEFFTLYALEQNKLSVSDIISIDLDPQKATDALTNGTIDVATTFEPAMSMALAKMHGNKLYTSADAPGVITDILTFRSDFIDKNPDTIQAIVNAYFKGVKYWKEHPTEANTLIGKELGVSGDEAAADLQGIDVLDVQENKVAFTYGDNLQSLYGNMKQIGKFVLNQKPTGTVEVNTDLLIEPKFVNNLTNQ